MIEKIQKWWAGLSNLQLVLLIFLGNWVFWFFLELFSQWFSGEDFPSPQRRDFTSSFFTAIFWTILFNYYKVKSLFTKRSSKSNQV
jgi:hypothetical protein